MAHLLVDSILERKGEDILLLDLREQALFADYFLLCNAENDRQLRAIARGIVEDAKQKANERALAVEGEATTGWLLIDFGDLVVHIFLPEQRAYYNLEELWQEAYPVLRMQ